TAGFSHEALCAPWRPTAARVHCRYEVLMMRIAVDISLYPLSSDFLPPIKDVISRLNAHPALEVETNPMSTQIRGEYDEGMNALQQEMKRTFDEVPTAVFAIRILNNPMADRHQPDGRLDRRRCRTLSRPYAGGSHRCHCRCRLPLAGDPAEHPVLVF